jgi:hypothetical protein
MLARRISAGRLKMRINGCPRSIIIAVLIAFFTVCFYNIANAALKKSSSAGTPSSQALEKQQQQIDELSKEIAELKLTRAKTGYSGYDNGFFIRSGDGDYEFKVRFFAQIYYEYDAINNAPDTNTFGLRRARLLLSGNAFTKDFTYMLMAETVSTYNTPTGQTTYTIVDSGGDTAQFTVTDTTDRNFRLLYLWAQYHFADEFEIRAGEFIPPTEFFFRASNLLEFGDFPTIAVAEPFTPNFQTGIDFLGTVAKKFDYEVFAVNGSNFDRVNLNKAFRIGACLTYNFLGRPGLGVADVNYSEKPQLAWTVSGAYERPDYTMGAPVNINKNDDAFRAQTNMVFRYRGFAIVPEFIVFYDKDQHFRHYAAAAQTGYFIVPKKFEVDAEAEYLRYAGPQNDRYVFSGGFNYYFFGHPLKLQADYSYLINKMPGGDQKVHRARVGIQAGFF